MKVVIGADFAGFLLKEHIVEALSKEGFEFEDLGTLSLDNAVDFYDVAYRVAEAVASGAFEKGIVICGTGMGVSIVANKVPGAYCALCESELTAKLSRGLNNANILAMGGFLQGFWKGERIARTFLTSEFIKDFPEGDPAYMRKCLLEISAIEKKIQER